MRRITKKQLDYLNALLFDVFKSKKYREKYLMIYCGIDRIEKLSLNQASKEIDKFGYHNNDRELEIEKARRVIFEKMGQRKLF